MPIERHTIRQWTVNAAFALLIATPWFLAQRAVGRFSPQHEGDGLRFVDGTADAGIAFTHRPPVLDPKLDHIAPYVAMFGASVSMVDVDHDGDLDLYLTTSNRGGRNALYLNAGDGTFTDAAEAAGLADVNHADDGSSMGSVWADYDNDGDLDVLIYRWGYLGMYRNDGSLQFTDVSEQSGIRRWMNANAAVWWDFDRDGDLDIYVGGYFPATTNLFDTPTTKVLASSFEYATNGAHNVLFENLGDGTFADVTAKYGVDSQRWTLGLGSADFDGNGWPDLFIANDYGHDEVLFNQGGGEFTRVQPGGVAESPKSGMCVAIGDMYNSGGFDVFVSNISKRGYLSQGNNLWTGIHRDGVNVAVPTGVASTGWAWGAQFGDFNNDGWQDLVVTNGFISGDPDADYWYDMARLAAGSGAVFEDAANWPPIGNQSLSGYERSALFLNDGTGAFREVGGQVGLHDTQDGRGVATGDLDGDGDLDIVVANQRGTAVVYRNEMQPAASWIAFDLVGTRSNRDAVGASVTIHAGPMRQSAPVTAGNGFSSQQPHRLHFGLGSATVDSAVIRWPSGAVQTLDRPEFGMVHRIHEPDGESVSAAMEMP